ncbi:putative Lipoprotein [Pseudomonas syringae pv. actinidiae]|nr:putative Lipoprotein [Pseudomonas syringae pv. actinidiae]
MRFVWPRIRFLILAVRAYSISVSDLSQHLCKIKRLKWHTIVLKKPTLPESRMNIKSLAFPLLAATAVLLAGCSTPSVVTLQNGTQYITKDMPKTKSRDGFYEFEDISGKRVRIKADEVATVRPEE